MLLWLEGDVSSVMDAIGAGHADALLELGEAGYKARHVVGCSRDVARALSSRDELSDRARAYFRRIYGEYTQLGSVFAVPKYVQVSIDAVAPVLVGDVWRVPLSLFAAETFSESLTVICENDTDYEIYEALAKAWMRELRPDCVISATSRAGHGGSTATVIRRVAANPNPPYLCIVDSDRDVALGAMGPTARGVCNAWQQNWRSALCVLTCRELENALPLEAVVKCEEANGSSDALVENMIKVHPDLRDYACLKVGERFCRFHDIGTDCAGYRRTRNALAATSRRHPSFKRCGDTCGECECKVVPGLGEAFLQRFGGWLRGSAARRELPDVADWSESLREAVEQFSLMAMALPRRL